MNKLRSKIQLLWSDCENGNDIIREYCNEQIRLIQLSTENKIEQINKLSDELIAFVREYERTCIESYSSKNKSIINEDINKIINEANTFINEKQAYFDRNASLLLPFARKHYVNIQLHFICKRLNSAPSFLKEKL